MAVRISQEVLETVIAPDTVAVRVSQEVIEVVIDAAGAENPIAGKGAVTAQAVLRGTGSTGALLISGTGTVS